MCFYLLSLRTEGVPRERGHGQARRSVIAEPDRIAQCGASRLPSPVTGRDTPVSSGRAFARGYRLRRTPPANSVAQY